MLTLRTVDTKNIFKKASVKWGWVSQMVVTLEELAELSVEIAKAISGKEKNHPDKLVDELADAKIMIAQVEYNYGLEDLVDERIKYKLERLESFIDGNTHCAQKVVV